MKKLIWLVLLAVLVCGLLAACDMSDGNTTGNTTGNTDTEKPSGSQSDTLTEDSDTSCATTSELTDTEGTTTEEITTEEITVEETTAEVATTEEVTECQHVAVIDKAVEPTCKSYGKTEGSHCSACGEVLVEQQRVEKADHTPEFMPAKDATCTEKGLTEGSRCSVCKKVLVAQQSVAKLPHDYEDGKCTVCGDLEPSEGLEFTSVAGGYALSGIGTCKDEIIVIPSEYKGKPVVEIARDAIYYPDFDPKAIIIPDSVKDVRYYAISLHRFFTLYVGKNATLADQSVYGMGGCEIINRSTKTIPQTAFATKDDNAPYIIHSDADSRCEVTEDGFVFLKVAVKTYLCDYIGNAADIELPLSHNNQRYILSDYCFYRFTTISSVKLGDGVIFMGACAFAESSVSSVDLSGKFTLIPSHCFYGCSQLTSVVIPKNITQIDPQAFHYSGLVNVTVGESVKKIGHSAFETEHEKDTLYYRAKSCEVSAYTFDGFKNVVIGSEVLSIPKNFMKKNGSLESVAFEANSRCTTIESAAFSETAIRSVEIPSSVTTIKSAFEDCDELARIDINAVNLSTVSSAFDTCGTNTEGIDIFVAKDVTNLPSGFIKDSKVRSLTFEEGSTCKTIEDSFSSGMIKNVTIPASVEYFDRMSFNMATLTIDEDNLTYAIVNSCLINLKESALIAVCDSSYVIPENITVIRKGAFLRSGVTHIYIPDSILEMEDGCLNCESVVSVSVPFIGNNRNESTRLLNLFGDEHEYGYICVDLNAGFNNHERYYVPPRFCELTVRGSVGIGLEGLSMLTTLKIHENVTYIAPGALEDCSRIQTIYFGGTEEQWNKLKESGWLQHVTANVTVVMNADV
ncbi:MAG: hypothetical protein E7589_02705 [Ruminococcaceae bacterium]|nr:hypothetical protein [Oscillospiraceae bacterium]